MFDGSSIAGWKGIEASDMILMPDDSTAVLDPFTEDPTLTLLGSIGPTLGTNYIVDAFLVVVVGGIGQIKGAVIAAFALGILQATIEYSTTASIAKVLVFVAIVAFLQARPQGLVSVRQRGIA